jgi:transcriptional regulator with XRE-family HTH domain
MAVQTDRKPRSVHTAVSESAGAPLVWKTVFSSQSSSNGTGSDLGSRVRSLRRRRGLTLKALGRLAGLSHPFLSQVERGLARPSVTSVERIAGALNVPVAHLWAPERSRDVRIVRHDAGAPGWRELLSGAPVVLEWSGGSRRWPDEASEHAGDVLVYVARGALDVDLDGTVHELEEGDAVVFDGSTPHRLRRRGSPSTRALVLKA